MIRFSTIFAAFAAAAFVITPALASDNSWADEMIDAQKTAERPVISKSVRVASLGETDVDTDSRPLRPLRAKRATKSIDAEDRPQARRTRVASLGSPRPDSSADRPRRSLSGGSVNWTADSGCLDGTLRGIIRTLAASFGPVTVNSTCRSRSHNASVGGAPKSYHLRGEAVDFRVRSNVSAVYASLRSNGNVGGLKHYGGGLFHIDTGPRRSW